MKGTGTRFSGWKVIYVEELASSYYRGQDGTENDIGT